MIHPIEKLPQQLRNKNIRKQGRNDYV